MCARQEIFPSLAHYRGGFDGFYCPENVKRLLFVFREPPARTGNFVPRIDKAAIKSARIEFNGVFSLGPRWLVIAAFASVVFDILIIAH